MSYVNFSPVLRHGYKQEQSLRETLLNDMVYCCITLSHFHEVYI